ncbi:hypothetical protein M1L65_06065 [Slackia exigua]|uniref:hypothetical protein n=1 Tax=Slackia exigua TaxID=84109 RepID=UPI003B9ED99F
MKTIKLDASYHAPLDMLYAGDVCSPCDRIEDTPSGETVMYSASGKPIGVEVSSFSKKKNSHRIAVDSKDPFYLEFRIVATFPAEKKDLHACAQA